MKVKLRAISVIEIVIVIAIIGILAAIVYPAYNNYIVRSKLTSALNLLSTSKDKVAYLYIKNATMPATIDIDTIANPTAEINSLTWTNSSSTSGYLEANFNATVSELNNTKLRLTAVVSANNKLEWTCSTPVGNAIDSKYLPASCL